MSLAPNPDKFAAAHVNIDRVAQPQLQLQRNIMGPAPAPIMPAPALTPAYNQLQQGIFPSLQSQQLAATQAAAQATAAPVNAFAAVEKQLKSDPWSKPITTTPFLNPTVTKPAAPVSGWVSNSLSQI